MKHRQAARALTKTMPLAAFDNGYWYATELKQFAHRLGITGVAALRKDQLEAIIRQMLRTGRVPPARRGDDDRDVVRDVARGLSLSRRVVRYTNDTETKAFLEREAARMSPGYRRRSGARYRLNRWRDAQLAAGRRITYRDLVAEYVHLSAPSTRYERIAHGRYINFMSDFLAREPGATRSAAVAAWHALKALDCPKTYAAWRKARGRKAEA